ncbi:MAG: hypothetical protein ACYC9Y_09515 [Candidatus Methylomirabilia bacterium]
MAASYLEEIALPQDERRAVSAAARYSLELDLFGTGVRLSANTPAAIEGVRGELGLFEVPPRQGRAPGVEIAALLEDGVEPRATFVAGERSWRLRGSEFVAQMQVTLVHLAEARVRTAYLAHAGCVSLGGRGVVIAAPSRMGKSTLAAHLAVRGAGLLSDELAPLERASGLVLPASFPVGIRPGAGEPLLAGRETADYVFRNDRKKLVAVSALTGRPPAAPVRPDIVLFLTPRAEASVLTLAKHGGRVRLALTGWNAALGAELASLPGLRLHARSEEDELTLLDVEMADPVADMPALRRIVADHGVALAGVRLEGLESPDFDAEPTLLRIPAAAGVLEFAKKIIPHQVSELIAGEFGGRMAPLLEDLARLLRASVFYKLTPGRLESMLQIIEGLP